MTKPHVTNRALKAHPHRTLAVPELGAGHCFSPRPEALVPAKILVPVDFTTAALWSIRYAGELAARCNSSICLLHVLEWGAFPNDLRNLVLIKPDAILFRDTKASLTRLARRELAFVPHVSVLVRSGKVGAEIVATAREEGNDLIILTADYRGVWQRLRHLVTGSVASWVERHASCPVLALAQRGDALLPDWLGSNARHAKHVGQHLAQAA